MRRLRLLAFAACLPAVVGAWLLVDADDIAPAMAWLLIPAVVAGAVLSARLYPLRLTAADNERMNRVWKRIFADIGLIALGYLVMLFASAVATQFVEDDLSVFLVNGFIAVIAAGAGLLGVVASVLSLIPLAMLVRALGRIFSGQQADGEEAAGALVLLSVGVFATSLVLATSIDTGSSPRGEAWTALFVLLTGIQSDDARIVSEPLAWLARGALLLLVVSVVVLNRLSARRKRAAVAA